MSLIVCIVITINIGYSLNLPVYNSNNEMTAEEMIAASKALENDIIPALMDQINTNASEYRSAIISEKKLWPNGIVYYTVDESIRFSAIINETLNQMMSEIGKRTDGRYCITFTNRKTEPNYVQYQNGDGCASSVGMIGGRQELFLGNGCQHIGTVMHETMHALGFYHEMNRNDRDLYVTVHYENVRALDYYNFEKFNKEREILFAPFDLDSIMIYGNKAFSINSKDTITANNGQKLYDAYAKNHLTKYNIQEIRALYKCDQSAIVTTLIPTLTTTLTLTTHYKPTNLNNQSINCKPTFLLISFIFIKIIYFLF